MRKIVTTVLTGFLGSGKTTLLNHILSSTGAQKIAVIVNEFGEVGIDGQLVIDAEEDILELNNGCICCTVRGDLSRAVANLIASDRAIDRIVIETTGLADPAPVIQSFILDETLRSHTELDAIVTVVDARHIVEQLHNEQAREQVAFADVLLLNKTDLVPEPDVAKLRRLLRSLNPLARIHQTMNCHVDLADVLDVRYKDPTFRARSAREPRTVLKEFGLDIAPSVQIKTWDSSAQIRWFVVPERPPGTDGMSEADLAKLVTPEGMMGVARV